MFIYFVIRISMSIVWLMLPRSLPIDVERGEILIALSVFTNIAVLSGLYIINLLALSWYELYQSLNASLIEKMDLSESSFESIFSFKKAFNVINVVTWILYIFETVLEGVHWAGALG